MNSDAKQNLTEVLLRPILAGGLMFSYEWLAGKDVSGNRVNTRQMLLNSAVFAGVLAGSDLASRYVMPMALGAGLNLGADSLQKDVALSYGEPVLVALLYPIAKNLLSERKLKFGSALEMFNSGVIALASATLEDPIVNAVRRA